ncbi:MAG: hypothetical protein SWY16_05360 [Cyanobacteriota bacterium]|nr:hypothetical protein [Cyanobacteriota bacterium]
MLKFTYTETDVQLERLMTSPEELVAQRVTLAMRVGHGICVEPTQASFLLPNQVSGLVELEAIVRDEAYPEVSLCVADAEFVEISLGGTWIAENSQTCAGVFVTAVSPGCELLLLQLWQTARSDASCLRE